MARLATQEPNIPSEMCGDMSKLKGDQILDKNDKKLQNVNVASCLLYAKTFAISSW